MSSVAFIDPDGMLNAWPSRVRITSTMTRTWSTARTLSASPPSLRFPSVDTVIGISRCLIFREELYRRDPIGTRCVWRLRRAVDEICRDLGPARAELPHVVTDKRKFDEARSLADQLRDM